MRNLPCAEAFTGIIEVIMWTSSEQMKEDNMVTTCASVQNLRTQIRGEKYADSKENSWSPIICLVLRTGMNHLRLTLLSYIWDPQSKAALNPNPTGSNISSQSQFARIKTYVELMLFSQRLNNELLILNLSRQVETKYRWIIYRHHTT